MVTIWLPFFGCDIALEGGVNVALPTVFLKAKNAITKGKTAVKDVREKSTGEEATGFLAGAIKGVATVITSILALPTIFFIGIVLVVVIIFLLLIDSVPFVVFGIDLSDQGGSTTNNFCNEDPTSVEHPFDDPPNIGLAIPHYLQGDERWGHLTYYNNDAGWNRYITLSAGGCDSTSFAMVASYLLDRTIYPSEIITHLDTSWRTWNDNFGRISEIYGIKRPTFTSNWSDMKEAIKNNQPVIAWYSGESGIFTKAGHFIVVRGITSDEKYIVNDPTDNMVDYKHDYYKRKFTEAEMTKGFGWGVIFEAKVCVNGTDYLQWAIDIANDDSHGYSQCNRWGPDYDCSSLVWYSLLNSGYSAEELGGSAFSTGYMDGVLTSIGFERHNYNASELQPGDILLVHTQKRQHTAIYAGDGKVVQASSSRQNWPGKPYGYCGTTGDQSGTEIWVTDNTGTDWLYYYRKSS